MLPSKGRAGQKTANPGRQNEASCAVVIVAVHLISQSTPSPRPLPERPRPLHLVRARAQVTAASPYDCCAVVHIPLLAQYFAARGILLPTRLRVWGGGGVQWLRWVEGGESGGWRHRGGRGGGWRVEASRVESQGWRVVRVEGGGWRGGEDGVLGYACGFCIPCSQPVHANGLMSDEEAAARSSLSQ